MIVKKRENIKHTPQHVNWGNGTSTRLLTQADKVGYSVTDTYVNPNSSSLLEYKNHLESCYCVAGYGEVTDSVTGEKFSIKPGTIYCLDNHEEHILTAGKDGMRLICVFIPALQGWETHNLNGELASSY